MSHGTHTTPAGNPLLAGATLDENFTQRLDEQDVLRGFRQQFHHPVVEQGPPALYLCGNSLGLQPVGARRYVDELMDNWARRAVLGHFQGEHPFANYHEFVRDGLAEIAGARGDEVVAMNTLTVNLHLMLASFYQPTDTRRRIVLEAGAFPSDRYAITSHLRVRGIDAEDSLVELAPRTGEACLRTEDICDYIREHGPTLALVMLPGVQYYTGEVYDMAAITQAAHRAGVAVGFDLAHAIGNVPLHLHDWGADFAIWCHYKYVNAGPGAVAGAFVHERHARADLPRLAGWWGHDAATRFQMGPEFVAMAGAEGWQLSNPPVLSLAPLIASLEVFQQAGMARLREKSRLQWDLLQALLQAQLPGAVETITPTSPARHGCQSSLRIRGDGDLRRQVFSRLEALNVICDWREPDVIRVAPTPLYNSFHDVWRLVDTLRDLVPGVS